LGGIRKVKLNPIIGETIKGREGRKERGKLLGKGLDYWEDLEFPS